MTALAVLVLLLFFILLALSLTVWAALSMGTKRRRALAAPDDRDRVAPAPTAPPAVRVLASTNTSGRETEGRVGRAEQKRTIRDPSELPWLRPPSGAEPATDKPGPATREKAERGTGKAQRPRVVVTDAESAREQESEQASEPGRATVSPGKVERDAFDRFLDAERRRE